MLSTTLRWSKRSNMAEAATASPVTLAQLYGSGTCLLEGIGPASCPFST
jgi:hypothetical protein